MIKVLFVCHGNICRSTMAQSMFADMVAKIHRESQFEIDSAATSYEEIGNPPHYGTQAELKKHGISCGGKRAVLLRNSDYDKYDLILGMDRENIRDMKRLFNGDPYGKVHLLKEYSTGGEVDDPWYSGDFQTTYNDISLACNNLLNNLKQKLE